MKQLVPLYLLLSACYSMLSWAQPSEPLVDGDAGTTVNLGTTVEGNQEQPRVLYIVPWASASGPGELDPLGRQGNNVFRRAFEPVERIELRRQMHYLKQQRINTSEK